MMKKPENLVVNKRFHWQSGKKMPKILVSLFCFFIVSVSFGANYYVTTTGKNTNDGLSLSNAWRTISYAATIAKAGDSVYIKSGLYKNEVVVISNSGTKSAPVIFQGFKNTPGDKPDAFYKPGGTLDTISIPVIEGNDLTGTAIAWITKSYIEIRNIGISFYEFGICPANQYDTAGHIVFENIFAVNQGYAGFWIRNCTDITIRNCIVADAYWFNLLMDVTTHSLLDNVKSYATVYDPSIAATDYHIQLRDSHDNIVQNCLAHNLHDSHTTIHPGHGIGIKDNYKNGYNNPHSHNNTFINCVAYNLGENLYVSHEAYNNVFENCTVKSNFREQYYWSDGLGIRDGAHDNIFRKCTIEGVRTGIGIQETVEGPPAVQRCTSNTIANCLFINSNVAIQLASADNNRFKNCVFDSTGQWTLVRFFDANAKACIGNKCHNSIVTNITGNYQLDEFNSGSKSTFLYTNFWENSFSMPPGEGNMAKDPLFVDRIKRDYHLKSTQGHWEKSTSSWVIDDATSFCIDRGLATDDYSLEPSPNGNNINIGVYGGTEEASKSPASACLNKTSDKNTVEFTIYHNPFRVSSSINYSSRFTNHITIVVYDLQGKRIKTLLDEEVSNGYTPIQWDGTNSLGQKSANGIYFLRLVTGTGYTKIVKVLF